MKYFAVLTLALSAETITTAKVITADPGTTRSAIYHFMHDQIAGTSGQRWQLATTVFFCADPENPEGNPS